MNLVLEMESSLEFWRRVYPLNRAPQGPVALPRGETACSGEDVSRLAPKWMTPQFLAQTDGRIKPQHRGALPQRVVLRSTLFRWNDSYGAVRGRDGR